jgi:hypothetical protein
VAREKNYVEVGSLLIEAGAEVNAVEDAIWACKIGHCAAYRYFYHIVASVLICSLTITLVGRHILGRGVRRVMGPGH